MKFVNCRVENREGERLEVSPTQDGSDTVLIAVSTDDSGDGWGFFTATPSDARAVAAEIIACADRIEGKESGGPPRAELVPVVTHVTNIAPESTPTHTSHASLVVFAKAIAYLPTPMRDELNALLASKLRVALS